MIRIYNQGGSLFIGEDVEGVLKQPRQIGLNKEGQLGLGTIIGTPNEMKFVGSFSNWEVEDEGLIKTYKEGVTGLVLV